jgi:predicted RNA-binding protein associated with RNAse of E/G family
MSGSSVRTAPNVVANVDLTNAALEVDISGLAQGDYDLIDVDSLTGTLSSRSLDGASLAQVGNRLVLTVS